MKKCGWCRKREIDYPKLDMCYECAEANDLILEACRKQEHLNNADLCGCATCRERKQRGAAHLNQLVDNQNRLRGGKAQVYDDGKE